MPVYYINIRGAGDDIAIDSEGQYFSSLDDVLREVSLGARELVADILRSGLSLEVLSVKVFEIRDEAGNLVREVQCRQALDQWPAITASV